MDDDLVTRLTMLECRRGGADSIARDFRVIEMQIARAEDKILRIARASSWTDTELSLFMTEEF